jgi:hypothetical protein
MNKKEKTELEKNDLINEVDQLFYDVKNIEDQATIFRSILSVLDLHNIDQVKHLLIRKKTANDSKHHPIMANDWETYLMEAIKTGLESPTPYKVIPYKNGQGIKKIELI